MSRKTPLIVVVAMSLVFSAGIALSATPARAASPFTVDSAADSADASLGDGVCATALGKCTLRAAIQEANLRSGPDTISFNIPGTGVKTIQLESALPTISDKSGPTTIDGYTQPGSSPNTDPLVSNAKIMVQITAPTDHTRDGLVVMSPNNTIRGLSFFKLRRSIQLYGGGASNNTVTGNFVGTDAAGNHAASVVVFPADGITMQAGAHHNNIGGTSAADRNVVSGNAYRGIMTAGSPSNYNRIINNMVGLGPAGDKQLANAKHGIDINGGSSYNQIGGTGAGERNVVSGNGQEGVEISHEPTTTQNRVVGNLIGTDATGNSAPAYARNGEHGVNIQDRVNNNLVSDNVIGNSGKAGVAVIQTSTNNVIENNRIGVSLNGTRIPNATAGVQVSGDSTGQRVGPNNTVTNNGTGGVRISSASTDRNIVTRNSIFGNVGLGIDIDPLWAVNPNDAGDLDSGANEQLNFPVLTSATSQTVTGTACGGCTVEVFLADGGAGAYGEGRTFVGSATASSDGRFSVTVSGVTGGRYVTATATDTDGNTSEFSLNRLVA